MIATQNPIEYEGTFPLPEAQLDRFMLRLRLGYPKAMEEIVILDEQKRQHPIDELQQVLDLEELREMQAAVKEIYVDQAVAEYIVRLTGATREHADVYLGASPRGSINLYRAGQALASLDGRDYVIPDDIKQLAVAVLGAPADRQEPGIAARGRPGRDRARDPGPGPDRGDAARSATAGPARHPPMGLSRQLRVVFFGTALVVAAFSTGINFLFFLVYLLATLLLASRWYARRGLRGLRAGYHVLNPRSQVGDMLEAVYRVDNDSRWSKPWVEVCNESTLPAPLPGRVVGVNARGSAAWLAKVEPAAPRQLPARRAAGTHRRSVRPLLQRDGGGAADLDRRLPRVHPLPHWRLPPSPVDGTHAVAAPLRGGDTIGQHRASLRVWRRDQPHPLAQLRAPRRADREGVRSRAGGRPVAAARPAACRARRIE